jgi:hypothetical protein
MALRAGQRRMRPGKGIIRIQQVIECDRRPVGCAVARVARGGESCRGMIGVRRPRPIRLMATVAGGGKSRVVAVGVALRAWDRRVGAGQREHRCVIERGCRPVRGCVAQRAIRGEAGGNVIRIRRSSEVRLVAAIASRRCRHIGVFYVTLNAGHSRMGACQGVVGV